MEIRVGKKRWREKSKREIKEKLIANREGVNASHHPHTTRNKICLKTKTSNLRKAHVTRDSSGPDTWAVVYSMQWNNSAFWRSTQIWGLRTEDSVNLRSRNLDCIKWTFYANNFIGIRRLSRFIFGYFDANHCWNVRRSQKLKKNTKIPYRSRFKISSF